MLLLATGITKAQTRTGERVEDVEMIIPASDFDVNTVFHMKNIFGSVKVTGYEGDEILISGTKTTWKKNSNITASEADEVYLDSYHHKKNLFVFIQAPDVEIEKDDDDLHYHIHWNDKKKNRNRVRFEINLELKVPNYLRSEISTINGGEVEVENMRNGITANNVNGDVKLLEVSGETHAHTVNGDIAVLFAENPETDASFNTVNGKIEIEAYKNLSAVVTFKSLHGDLYTDFDDIKHLPNRLNKTSNAGAKRYKIEQSSPIQIGNGGPEISFQLVNGSAYIKQRKS